MKSLLDFKTIVEEEKSDYSKFDALVRAGLANKAQIQRIHKILDKMGEERPNFNNADKMIIQNLFTKMVNLISNNKQINQQARRAVKENIEGAENWNKEVITPASKPFQAAGAGIVVVRGSLAPDGAIIKVSAASPNLLTHKGKALVFKYTEDVWNALAGNLSLAFILKV